MPLLRRHFDRASAWPRANRGSRSDSPASSGGSGVPVAEVCHRVLPGARRASTGRSCSARPSSRTPCWPRPGLPTRPALAMAVEMVEGVLPSGGGRSGADALRKAVDRMAEAGSRPSGAAARGGPAELGRAGRPRRGPPGACRARLRRARCGICPIRWRGTSSMRCRIHQQPAEERLRLHLQQSAHEPPQGA